MREVISDRHKNRVVVETVKPKRLVPRDERDMQPKKRPPDGPEYATEELRPRPRQPGGYMTR